MSCLPCLCLFVGWLMSCLSCLCLFVGWLMSCLPCLCCLWDGSCLVYLVCVCLRGGVEHIALSLCFVCPGLVY